MLLKRVADDDDVNEYVFPRTVDEHVVPAVVVVPVNETVTALHEFSHEPATLYPVVLAHVNTFFY